jgi:hypothetical protein
LAKRDFLIIDDGIRDPVSFDQASQIIEDLDEQRFRSKWALMTSKMLVPDTGTNDSRIRPWTDAILDRRVYDTHRLELKGGFHGKEYLHLGVKRALKTQEEIIQRHFAPRRGRFFRLASRILYEIFQSVRDGLIVPFGEPDPYNQDVDALPAYEH